MKGLFIFCLFMILAMSGRTQSVGVGTDTPDQSAALEVTSITQGMLVPRMTSAQRGQIANPATGLLVFDITTGSFWFRSAGGWIELLDTSDKEVFRNGSNMIYTGMTSDLGVGTSSPSNKVDILGGLLRTGSHAYGRPLYVTGNYSSASLGIEFRHDTGTQGIGFGYNTIYATGSDENQGLGLAARGPGGSLTFLTNGMERMRILGNGKVGIGTTTPDFTFSVLNKFGVDNSGALHFKNAARQIYFFEDPMVSKMILSHSPSYPTWGLEYINDNRFRFLRDSIEVLTVNLGSNNVVVASRLGIGNSDPHAALQFSNAIENRKLVLYEFSNNDHQYYGFGINPSALRYQSLGDHVFYHGTGPSSSNEVMRVRSNGNVDIPGYLEVGWTYAWSSQVTINPQTGVTVTCDCPPGTTVLSGGGSGSCWGAYLVASYASSTSQWSVSYWNANLGTTCQVSAFALCARIGN